VIPAPWDPICLSDTGLLVPGTGFRSTHFLQCSLSVPSGHGIGRWRTMVMNINLVHGEWSRICLCLTAGKVLVSLL